MKTAFTFIALLGLLLCGAAQAATVTTAQSGEWRVGATWVGGSEPTETDDVLIGAGHTISVDDATSVCSSISFADTSAHIDMNSNSRLTIHGDFTLAAESHNVFSAGWSGTSAYVYFVGNDDQTLAGWSTTGGSTSFRDIVIDKPADKKVATAGNAMRFAVQNSLEIISGIFEMGADDEFEARFASSANFTNNQVLQIIVRADGQFLMVDGTGSHWIRSNVGSIPIGKMTVYGIAEFYDASSSDISIGGIDVKEGGSITLGTGLWTSSSGAMFNPGTITVEAGGEIECVTTSDIWFPASSVVLNPGATYKTTSSTTIFPPTLVNNGKVRYQRTSSTQTVADLDYYDLEFSFGSVAAPKQWALTGGRLVADSLTVNNSAAAVLSASSPQTLTVNGTVRLTSGLLDITDPEVILALADGGLISRATGEISTPPLFLGGANVRYTSTASSVATGPELPTDPSTLMDLTVFCTGQTVTLSADATVNGNLILSAGLLDNSGAVLAMADGATIRRATGTVAAPPAFGSMANVEYISTVSPVTTGLEIPADPAVLQNLTITGDQGVTLSADVTVNGVVSPVGSELNTGSYKLILGQMSLLSETSGFVVQGTVEATRSLGLGVNESFSGIGLEINADNDSPGETTVRRVTGSPYTIADVTTLPRYFEVLPAVNTGLAATTVLHYDESELGGMGEGGLLVYASNDAGATWSLVGGTVDASANTVTVTDVDGFSLLTLAAPIAVALEPPTLYAFQAFAVNSITGTIYLGGTAAGNVNDINLSSLRVNGSIEPAAAEVVNDYAGFPGDVLMVTFPIPPLVAQFVPSWGTTVRPYALTGEFNDASPFGHVGEFVLIGHRSGDVNADGQATVSDLTYLVAFIFRGGPSPVFLQPCDATGDCQVNVADITAFVKYLFRGGPEPQSCHD